MKRCLAAQDLAERLELPEEALGALRLTLIGGRRALAENHRGILEYGEERIRLAGQRGSVTLEGSGLRLGAMNRRELLIVGKIQRVEWDG